MADIFDYITWRGDMTFEQDGVNCVDALIFSQMAYFPMDRLWGMEEDGIITIRQVQERLQEKLNQGEHVEFHMEKDEKLFHAMALSRRFGELALSGFVNIIDAEEEKQFAAVTVHLPESLFLLFRGTDCTFVGWNEDLNMSFSTPVPAQVEAVNYFEKTAERFAGKGRFDIAQCQICSLDIPLCIFKILTVIICTAGRIILRIGLRHVGHYVTYAQDRKFLFLRRLRFRL